MKFLFMFIICSIFSLCHSFSQNTPNSQVLVSILDTIYHNEQGPIAFRDLLMDKYGPESKKVQEQDLVIGAKQAINQAKVFQILDTQGWPGIDDIGADGSRTLYLVIQHSSIENRIKYIPMMKQAVDKGDLAPRYLANVEDRAATYQGKLQIYGNQIKYYPETKIFDVWPIYDPINVDERRALVGLGPIADHLKNRFDLQWDIGKQLIRSKEFTENSEK